MLQKLMYWLFFITISFSQTTSNPQFSVVGDLVFDHYSNNSTLASSGIEIAVQGYVNPFARADVYLHKHNDDSPIELEEAVMTIERGLPIGLGLRVGKFRPDLGKINQSHAHLFPFIEAPSSMTKILGEEFWAATGAEINILLPLPWYSNFSFGYFDANIGSHDHEGHMEKKEYDKEDYDKEDHDDHKDDLGEKQENSISLRWSQFFELNEINHLELGISGYSEHNDQIMGVDLKYKWRPSQYRSLTFQAEVLQQSLAKKEITNFKTEDKLTVGYAMANYQFNKSYNLGIIADYSLTDHEGKKLNPSIFFGFSPVEESTVFRIKVGQVENHETHKKQLKTIVQIIWSLGPHKPHRY